ncbi:MAG: bifunctional DNA-formamidopyrimidine glycosylase/DNA-(apurinic or apyrimidinic site) lyase [bacterium]|nr:bifunctional DNA-formamidopyrimidine glycosylase/DNA-(apurinic or apyrimidinic site) lyase [bacterium]
MPELPEVETIVRQIGPMLRGTVFERVRHLRGDIVRNTSPRVLRRRVSQAKVHRVRRRGKRVVLDLDGDLRLVFGLGMTGHLAVLPVREELAAHTHLRIILAGGVRELRFRDPRRFGGVWLIEGGDDSAGFTRLGVEPLTTPLRAFRGLLKRARQVKALLLDQATIAGLGNIYCDESLHRAGIHPQTQANTLTKDQVKRLHEAIRRILRAAIAAEGTTVSSYLNARGVPGSFQQRLRVYGRTGEACPKCGTTIELIIAAGRTTHLCPSCQRRRP